MELSGLSFFLFIHFTLAGDMQDSYVISKVFNGRPEATRRPLHDNRPRNLDKRSRILKFGKYDHAGRCFLEKCDWLRFNFTETIGTSNYQGQSKELLPNILDSENLTESQKFSFKGRKVKNKEFNLARNETNFRNEVNRNIVHPKRQGSVNYEKGFENNFINSSERVYFRRHHKNAALLRKKARRNGGRILRRKIRDAGQKPTIVHQPTSTEQESKTPSASVVVAECVTKASKNNSVGNESRMPYDWDKNSYMALGSLGFLLLVLTSAVMYTGLWKKRNSMLYPSYAARENPPERQKVDIKELLKAKLGKIPVNPKRIRSRIRSHRNHHHHHYTELPLLENGEAGDGIDDVDYSEPEDSQGEEKASW